MNKRKINDIIYKQNTLRIEHIRNCLERSKHIWNIVK